MTTQGGWMIESEPEVTEWARGLTTEQFARAVFYVDLLEQQGSLLSEPYTRQLRGKLRELRFHLETSQWRMTYYIGTRRRIVLLTVFRKTQRREAHEIDRAERAMNRCIDERHLEEEAH
ncbi:MAG: type II toxin-antitoxin system RelE/ParE family toxin [Dehalococcoidia bacterium]